MYYYPRSVCRAFVTVLLNKERFFSLYNDIKLDVSLSEPIFPCAVVTICFHTLQAEKTAIMA